MTVSFPIVGHYYSNYTRVFLSSMYPSMYGCPELNDPMVQALTMGKVAVNKKGEQSMETD